MFFNYKDSKTNLNKTSKLDNIDSAMNSSNTFDKEKKKFKIKTKDYSDGEKLKQIQD